MRSLEQSGTHIAGKDAPIRSHLDESPPAESRETVFSVLAARARTHPRAHLALTTIIGAVDAIALGWAHPALWPLATLFGAVGAYGAWGLLDRLLADRRAPGATPFAPSHVSALRVVREMTAIVGVIAALAAVGGIWDASLGGWRH